MNLHCQFQSLHPNAGQAWRNPKQAPPKYGQREYSLMLSRKFASKGVTSPPAQIGYSYGVPKQSA